MDPQIIQFLCDRKRELSLNFLEKFHKIYQDFKLQDPDLSVDDFLGELKKSKSDYASEISNLTVAKAEAEIKLSHMKRYIEKELQFFSKSGVENLLKDGWASEYLDKLKDKNKTNQDIVKALKRELASKQNEITDIERKVHEAKEQLEYYQKAHNDISIKVEKLETKYNDLPFFNLMNPDQMIPTPPDTDVPPLEELLAVTL